MNIVKKKIGIGTITLLLCFCGLLFCFTFKNGMCIGDTIINSIGLNAWSNNGTGTHYVIFYSLIFFIISIVLGLRFKDDFGANIGKRVSIFLCLIFIAISFTMVI